MEAIILIYIMGIIISALYLCSQYFLLLTSQFQSEKSVYKYLFIQRVLFWPYFLAQKNPLALFSTVFFSRYGNEYQSYFGTMGLTNFLADVIKGKERYRDLKPHIQVVPIDSQDRINETSKFPIIFTHAELLFAKAGDRYLLRVVFLTGHQSVYSNGPTRFDLDSCQRLDREEFILKLKKIVPGNVVHICSLMGENVGVHFDS